MATQQTGESAFIQNLGKIYGIYTGGFAAFVIFLAILEQIGVPERIIGFLFVGFTLLIYAGIGILSRTMQVSEYYVAGRRVPAIYNGMATAADWMSGAIVPGHGRHARTCSATTALPSCSAGPAAMCWWRC